MDCVALIADQLVCATVTFSLLFSITSEYGCGNMFGRVCVCMSVCPVHVLTFESLDLQTSLFMHVRRRNI